MEQLYKGILCVSQANRLGDFPENIQCNHAQLPYSHPPLLKWFIP